MSIVVTRDNKPETLTVMASARQIEGGRWAVDGLRLPLPVSRLANSTYILRVTATAGEHSAEQWAACRVAR